jgi:hypothetical protein
MSGALHEPGRSGRLASLGGIATALALVVPIFCMAVVGLHFVPRVRSHWLAWGLWAYSLLHGALGIGLLAVVFEVFAGPPDPAGPADPAAPCEPAHQPPEPD